MRNPSRLVCALLCLQSAIAAAAASPKPLSAPEPTVTCAKCHVEARTQPLTQMAHALEVPATNATLKSHPKLTLHKGDYTYTVETQNGHTTYSVSDAARTIALPVVWGFGVGNQTWVLERDGKLYESLVSYYVAIDGLDTTSGDEGIKPHSLEEAMGREQPPQDAKACFDCHATGASPKGTLSLTTIHPGITCERCHQGSAEHFADILKGKEDTIPVELGKLSSEDTSSFCGSCHRTWELVVRSHWHGESNVRFQPYRIANSKCFDGTDPRISCVACHDVHQPLMREQSFYDTKCLACHASTLQADKLHADTLRPGPVHLDPLHAAVLKPASLAVAPASAAPARFAKPCPVAKSNCVSCHMPKVNMLGGHLTFTDHQIRIVKPGEPYPN